MSNYGCVVTNGRYSCSGEPLIEGWLNRRAGHERLSATTAGQLNGLVADSDSVFDTASALTLTAFYGVSKASAEPAFDSIARRFSSGRISTSSYLSLGMTPVIDMIFGLSTYAGEGDLSQLGALAWEPIKNLGTASERISRGEYAEGFYDTAVGLNVSVGLLYGSAAGAGAAVNTIGRVGGVVSAELRHSAGVFANLVEAKNLALAGGGRASSLAEIGSLKAVAVQPAPIPPTIPGFTPPPSSGPVSPMRTPGGTRIFPEPTKLPKQTIFPKPFGTPAERATVLSAEVGTEVIVVRDGNHLATVLWKAPPGKTLKYVLVELDVPSVNGVRPRELRLVPNVDFSFRHGRLLRHGERIVGAGEIQREFTDLIKFDGSSTDFPTTRLGVREIPTVPFLPARAAGIPEVNSQLRALLRGSEFRVYSDYL